jgi:hypothetical protein
MVGGRPPLARSPTDNVRSEPHPLNVYKREVNAHQCKERTVLNLLARYEELVSLHLSDQ